MSAYSDAVLATPGLVAYYRANEANGTVMVDSSGVAGNATYEASGVMLGQTSLLPADSDTCVHFDGVNGRAVLAHNASVNLSQNITIVGWVKPAYTRTQHIMHKFGAYGLAQRGSFFSWELDGIGTLWAPVNTVVANNSYMVTTTFNGTAQVIYMNGVVVGSVARSNLSLTQNTNALEIGSVIALERWGGHMAHLSLFNTALSQAAIQNLYVLGATTQAEIAGRSAQAYPFSHQILAANPARTRLTIWNDSNTTVYLSLGGTAVVGQGPRLSGNGDRWTISSYTGALSAIHNGFLGGKNLTISEE